MSLTTKYNTVVMNENNIDEMYRAWKKWILNGSEDNMRQMFEDIQKSGRRTSLENLAHRYKRFSILGLAMIPVSLCYANSNIFPHPYNIIISVGMMMYFALCSILDLWLYRGIRSIDIFKESVVEVSRKARYYRRRHLQFIAILVVPLVILLSLMLICRLKETYFIICIVAGMLTGLIIGLYALSRFMNEYKSLTDA